MRATVTQAAIAMAMIASAALAAPAGRTARCVVKTSDPSNYSGPCLFTPGPKGSFGLGPAKGKALLLPFTSLSVDIISPDRAEVRGLTVDGVNSRWGEAKRSKRDPACWQGPDFSVCVS